jgi:hypothetical protein
VRANIDITKLLLVDEFGDMEFNPLATRIDSGYNKKHGV